MLKTAHILSKPVLCLPQWGEMMNACPVCKTKFTAVRRARDGKTQRFGNVSRASFARSLADVADGRDEEVDTSNILCMVCEGGELEEQLLLCDSPDCENVRQRVGARVDPR